MRKIKKWLFPPLYILVLLTVISALALAVVFIWQIENSLLAIGAYVLSFYTLTVDCMACVFIAPRHCREIKKKIYESRIGHRYMTEPVFKMRVQLFRTLGINFLYAGLHFVSGIYFKTAWFMIFAAYYGLMAVLRFLLVCYVQKRGVGNHRLKELKRARLCAYVLLTLNLSLSGAVLMIVYQGRGFLYHGIFIYVMALYTFYITTIAIIHLIQYKKYKSPVMSMAKSVDLAAALVSMLSLETAMLSQFGGDLPQKERDLMIILTGAGIALCVLCMSGYTILKTSKEIKFIRKER